MASDIGLRTIQIARKETRCRHIGYSYRLTARVLLHAPSHRQDNTYHGLGYTSRGALAGTRNSSMGPPHEGSIRRTMSERSTSELRPPLSPAVNMDIVEQNIEGVFVNRLECLIYFKHCINQYIFSTWQVCLGFASCQGWCTLH